MRGRLLPITGRPSDAVASRAGHATGARVRGGAVSRLLGASGGAAYGQPGDLYLAAEMYLGLAQAEEGGAKKLDELVPRLQLAIRESTQACLSRSRARALLRR